MLAAEAAVQVLTAAALVPKALAKVVLVAAEEAAWPRLLHPLLDHSIQAAEAAEENRKKELEQMVPTVLLLYVMRVKRRDDDL